MSSPKIGWIVGVVLIAVRPVQAQDWNQWRGPNRNGVCTQAGLPSSWTPGPGGSGNVVWRQSTLVNQTSASPGFDCGSPVVVGSGASGRVFFMHSVKQRVSGRTVCLRESDGAFLWDYLTLSNNSPWPGSEGSATPCVDTANQLLYTATGEGRLQCLDWSGTRCWVRLAGLNTSGEDPNAFGAINGYSHSGSPQLDGGMVIFQTGAGRETPLSVPKLMALSASTGVTVWTQSFDYPIVHQGTFSSPLLATTPDSVRRVFFHAADGSLRCVNALNGQPLWTHFDNSGMTYRGVVGSNSGYASPVYNPPGPFEVPSGAVYVAAGTDPDAENGPGPGRLWKLNAQTGDALWEYIADLRNVVSSVAISGSRLYVADCGSLHCVNLQTGAKLWSRPLGGIWASPLVADGKVYFGTRSGVFYILADSDAFTLLDQDNVGSSIASSVAVANGALYIKSTNLPGSRALYRRGNTWSPSVAEA
ncbi:MAG: PQQ-binding-like beta-propeller repeat protein [Planctomycetes bacterium]|nr:PQQ-binding-like beta-propeller repeat protein [Planctomycetota bacterium]